MLHGRLVRRVGNHVHLRVRQNAREPFNARHESIVLTDDGEHRPTYAMDLRFGDRLKASQEGHGGRGIRSRAALEHIRFGVKLLDVGGRRPSLASDEPPTVFGRDSVSQTPT